MGIVLPTIVDEALDLIGINWPNVDEDDYYEMATSMRDFAEKFEGHGGDAHKAITRILSSSEGWAVDSMEKHWSHVKTNHLEKVPEVARLFADACDAVARIIVGMKTKAGIELGVLAGTVVASLAATPLTLGLSAGLAAVEIAAMREIVRRLVKEAIEEIIAELTAKLTEPVIAKLESLVTDMVLDLAEGAFNPSGGPDSGGTTLASAGTSLASADGSGGAGKRTHIDHTEFENGAGKVSLHGGDLNSQSSVHLGKTKGAFGRTKGRDSFTKDFDGFFDKSLDGVGKVLTRITKHVSEEIPDRVKAASRHQKENDGKVGKQADGVEVNSVGDGKGDGGGADGGRRGGAPDDGPRGGDEGQRKGPDHPDTAKDDPAKNGVPEERRKCKNDPVDVASGQMLMTQRDVSLPGVLPLLLRRTHLSDYRWGRWFGTNWASTLDERIEQDGHGEGAVWAREDGSMLIYPRLPQPSDLDGVMPVNGPALAMFHAGQDNGATTYRIEDRDSGVSRFFTGSWLNESPAYWLCELEDRNHNGITITRAGTGAPQEVVHDGGYRITVDVADRRVASIALQTPDGPVGLRRFDYDASGFLCAVTNAVEATMRFTYDVRGAMTSWTDSNDSTFRYEYDGSARVVRTIGPDGYLSSTFAYEELEEGGRLTRYTDALGAVTVHRINERYQLVAETDPLGNTTTHEFQDQQETGDEAGEGSPVSMALPSTHAEYDRPVSSTDPLGRTTRFEYDEAGRLVRLERCDGAVSTAQYNELGLPLAVTGFDGRTRRQEYDDRGNRTAVTGSDGHVTRYTYDEKGRPTSVTDPTGATTHVVTNEAGLPVQVTDVLGAVAFYRYDAFGRAVGFTDQLGSSSSARWSPEGKILSAVAADGSSESWTYDGEGNCLTHVDAVGGTSRFEYTHFDLLAARTGPDGARHEFTHDSELRLTRVMNPLGLTWNYTFDAAGRLISETDFDGRTQIYGHDADGRLKSRTTALGKQITYDHDLLGRTVRKDADGRITTYSYDQGGRLIEAAAPDVLLTMDRDEHGRLLSETVAGRRTYRHYDRYGRYNGRTTPSGARSTWTFDTAGRREALTTAGRTVSFTRDAAGRESARHFGEHLTLEHAYDEMGRRKSQTVIGAEGPVRQRDYHYREDGNLIGIEDSRAGARTFALDANGRVTGVAASKWSESYAYDAMGNQTHATWPDSHPGTEAQGERVHEGTRIQRAGRVRYEYDAAGRTTLRQKARLSTKPDTWRYTWDVEDRLTQVVTPDGTLWRYQYDALGRRTTKQRMADDGVTVVERVDFTWDGTTLCEQTAHTPDAPRSVTLTWDHQGHRPLAQTERLTGPVPEAAGPDGGESREAFASQDEIDARFYAIVTDVVGAPTELLDEHGDTAWHTRSTLWGTTAWSTNSTTYTPLRFPGQYFDPETGLHYNYFRHYDPETAQYVSPDPLGLAPAPNPVGYVANPHRWTDPLGLAPECDPPFEEAKARALREAGIPECAEPLEVDNYVPATHPEWMGSKQVMRDNKPVYYTEEVYEHPNGQDLIVFQDHWMGHREPGEEGHQRAHVHVRPIDDTRNGQVPGCEEHYYYRRES